MPRPIPFFVHQLGKRELASFTKTLAGPILTTGQTVSEFESKFSKWLGLKHCVGVTSCTGGLHIALEALGVGRDDEVITTPFTFIATATAIEQAGAKPVFVDVEPETGNLDVRKVAAAVTRKTKAVIPVHLYGQMCDMRGLSRVARKHRLFIVEDAAHCVEGERDGVRPGQLSDAVCFSFYATKNMTCGEGGAVAVNDPDLYARLKLLRHHGMNKTAADRQKEGYSHWDMVTFGWKYNMDNLQAALLLPQLERLWKTHRERQRLARNYFELLRDMPGVRFAGLVPHARHAWHLFVIRVDAAVRDRIIHDLNVRGIGTVVNYRPVHQTTYFSKKYHLKPGAFPISELLGSEVISLPFFPSMKTSDQATVARSLRKIMAQLHPKI
jgi:UDP-4-amino-4-deoxy-L-arabinose-oxoglutarate aminotransferase